jgi:Predicted membrane protein (DUF2207)
MLGGVSKARHVAVGGAVGAVTALTGFGLIGGGRHDERFDTWQVVVEPAGGEALRITETFDQDFGTNDRHGPLRTIPNDYGAPANVVASSPDAPDDLQVVDLGAQTEIRIGDADIEISGQHRYVLAYTLPAAQLSDGFLALDLLAGDEFETGRAEVVLRGFELDRPRCFVGELGATDQCELRKQGTVYRADLGELPPFTGVTIDGAIAMVTGIADLAPVEPLPLPDRRSDDRLPLTAAAAVLGSAVAVPIYRRARTRGSNEVYAGGAADAALGVASMPSPGSVASDVPPVTTLVTDDELARLATTEFSPPRGLQPWEAAVLLSERLDDSAIEAWMSGLAGREAVELTEEDDKLRIGSGPKRGELPGVDAALLGGILALGDPYTTGTYDGRFASAWNRIGAMQRDRIAASGWWKRGGPGQASVGVTSLIPVGLFVGLFGVLFFGAAGSVRDLLRYWPVALIVAIAVPALMAYAMYSTMLPSRSAQGSALALQAESFRRFLHASEARHVEWAWEHGLLREYSGWAAALGEADAWNDALARANVPEPARRSMGPIILVNHRSSVSASHTKPSSSSSSGGGGFSGGSVGGGGGGGSRGSW